MRLWGPPSNVRCSTIDNHNHLLGRRLTTVIVYAGIDLLLTILSSTITILDDESCVPSIRRQNKETAKSFTILKANTCTTSSQTCFLSCNIIHFIWSLVIVGV